MSDADSEFLCI